MITDRFDELVLTLLHRMSNLEKLDLSLNLSMKRTFIDGNYLKTNIINHIPRLDKFKFNIYSTFNIHNQIYFLVVTKICLPNTVHLRIRYQQLKRVTYNFTRNTTRINCTKLSSLCTDHNRIPKVVKDYFPHTEIF